MLEEARTSVIGGLYPPAPVYLLRILDWASFGNGPTLMVFVQDFTILGSLGVLGLCLGLRLGFASIVLIAFLATPTIIGCMLVLWKDVTLAAFSILGFTIVAVSAGTEQTRLWMPLQRYFALVTLWIASLMRFNGILLVVPLIIFYVNCYFSRKPLLFRVIMCTGIVLGFVTSGQLINRYAVNFEHGNISIRQLEEVDLAYTIMNYDLIGMSYWARVSFVPPTVYSESGANSYEKQASLDQIDAIYSSLGIETIKQKIAHSNTLVTVENKTLSRADLAGIWGDLICRYPMAYVRYRADLFQELIGLNRHETFEPTHFGRIDQNNLGIEFKERGITKVSLEVIDIMSGLWVGKPWFLFVLSAISFIGIISVHDTWFKGSIAYYSLFATVSYIAPFFLIAPTGEVRYAFPALVFAFVPLLVGTASFLGHWQFARRPSSESSLARKG
jgi:hypothetical protein